MKIVNGLKNSYVRYWSTKKSRSEFYLKLDGYYFSKKQNCTILVIQVRHKRTVDRINITDVMTEKNLILELHPVDACVIGILANNERNGLVDTTCEGWEKMKRLKHDYCFIKSKPILRVSKKYFDRHGHEITILYSPCLKQEIKISTIELSKNEALLYALDPLQAISVGYGASESYLRKSTLK